ncbi:hypothetical protein FRC10_002187 [Ceratobasidium sp. 414]|nr:hypothetical protein FRC10_002187 [Ceratobasidium sp. 414]
MSHVHETHVLAGYKATLSNPNVSPEAKANAARILAEAGETVPLGSVGNAHEQHVLAGYKAALSNPNVGPEAKAKAARILAEAGQAVTSTTSTTGATTGDEHDNRVLGDYKATLNNPNVGPVGARVHAEHVLAGAGVPVAQPTNTTGEEHDKHVLAGYKGVLSNPNTSEEAKEKATEILRAAGEL